MEIQDDATLFALEGEEVCHRMCSLIWGTLLKDSQTHVEFLQLELCSKQLTQP